MNFAEKIKADFEAITGLTLLYGSRDGINWAINHNALPAGFFTLIRSSNVDADGLSIRESAEVAVSVIRLSPAEEPGYETEEVIEECRQQVFAYLTAIKSSGLLELRSVTRASRIFDEFDDIVCGFGVNIVVKEIDGTRCIPWEGPTLNITENGDYETLRYGQVHVDVQGGTPAVIEPLNVTPTDEEQTITPTPGVDGFAPVVVGACPVCPSPHIQPLSVTPSTSNQTFTPSAPVDGYGPVDVAAVDSTIDHNIQPQNIKAGVDILGVSGAYHGAIEPLNVSPSTTAQTITPPAGTDGYAPVTVDAVTAAIDANITPANIKQGVEILGVVGTMEQGLDSKAAQKWYCQQIATARTRDPLIQFPSFLEELIDRDGDVVTMSNYPTLRFTSDWMHDIILDHCTSVPSGNAPLRAYSTGNFRIRGLSMASVTQLLAQTTGYGLLAQNGYGVMVDWLKLGTLTNIAAAASFGGMPQTYLRKFEVGQGTECDIPFTMWRATNVIAEGQSGIDELNANIVAGLADRVADRTGDTALTVTFGAALYNVLTPATIAAFTAKNWNVASA